MTIDRGSPEGNVFFILGVFRRLMTEQGRDEEWPDLLEDATSGDYAHTCEVVERESHGMITFID
ncbi:hypothetical protein [Aeoliella sp.]|uniref:hypothetical protein n=1 Tax=Aeoliella sp. TaxID=2795800 RepID=UPI003CCBFBB9